MEETAVAASKRQGTAIDSSLCQPVCPALTCGCRAPGKGGRSRRGCRVGQGCVRARGSAGRVGHGAVAQLSEHGGEGGLLGREEIDEIAPAVKAARELNIDATGPLPADSVFNRAIAGEFDVVLAMYHDQGHIAIKVHNFHESVTATLGIPLIRTSVDHGTAFDIAGLGIADATGAIAALRAAVALAEGTFGR